MDAEISFDELFEKQISHIQISGEGIVSAILNDDLKGHKHQRFIVRLAEHKTLMILNNIDIFPRLSPLNIGDKVAFSGEYVWNRHGGLLHWTHADPQGIHKEGYVNIAAESASALIGGKKPIPLGQYRHYKGGECRVTGFAIHSETLEDLIIYTYEEPAGTSGTWARPLSVWNENVSFGPKTVPRYKLIEEN